MKFKIAHEVKGRIRFDCNPQGYSVDEYDRVEYYFEKNPFVSKVKVYERTGSVALYYDEGNRSAVINAMESFDLADALTHKLPGGYPGNLINFKYKRELENIVIKRLVEITFLPMSIRTVLTVGRAYKYFKAAMRWLFKHDREVQVLDIAAVIASILTRNFTTASSIIFLLNLGEILEEWTHKRSLNDLARSLALNIDQVWTKKDGVETLQSMENVQVGDLIVIRMGSVVPVDGIVDSGEAMLNQASMTGESASVRKCTGDEVYAGTVVEEGEITVRTTSIEGQTRLDRIMKLIEESEMLKSNMQSRTENIVDTLVPYTFTGSALIYALTRNVTKSVSVLMADYSCTLHLSMPISVLSAMRESSNYGILIKGGKFMEAIAEADTVIFDKTGTLTKAEPRLAEIVNFNGYTREELLRIAACLEEHFPHSIGKAIVKQAEIEGVCHSEELHDKPEYVIARGISSYVEGKKVLIGSDIFLFEDEGIQVTAEEQTRIDNLPGGYSHLYMAIGGKLIAILSIEDPLRDDIHKVMHGLRKSGVSKIIMLTGDNEKTAEIIARQAGVDAYIAECLPEDKAEFIQKEKAAGRKVIMVGDGINDSPALSAADVGIAMSEGAQIANEISDVTISGDALYNIIVAREISKRLLKRIDKSYKFVVSFNTLLILLGITGIALPSTTAILHNVSTIGIGLQCMGNLITPEEVEALVS